MKRLFLALCAVVLLSAGCSEPTAPVAASDVIMELKTGNRWVARVSDPQSVYTETLEVESDTTVDGERWYRVGFISTDTSVIHGELVGPYLFNRTDGLYRPAIPFTADHPVVRAIKYPVALGDTAIDYGWFHMTYEDGSQGPRFHEFAIVTALGEKVDVEAGRFDAFKVEYRRTFDPVDSTLSSGTEYDVAWYAPRAGSLRAEKYDSAGAVIASWELIELKLN